MKYHLSAICFIFLLFSCFGDDFNKTIEKFGFQYNPSEDIYVSKVNAWQRRMGYQSIIDRSAPDASMIIDCEPVKFNYNGKAYMIELWKGQYGISTGAEIGIYKKPNLLVDVWECGDTSDMLHMEYSLKKNGNKVFQRNGEHWWLTGFKPGEFSEPEDLIMDISINFDKHPEWKNPFKNKLTALGYTNIHVTGNTVEFIFNNPKTPQPAQDQNKINKSQDNNKKLVKTYTDAKNAANVNDNSPESINKILKKSPKLLPVILLKNI